MPVQAGIDAQFQLWIPAFAGMTGALVQLEGDRVVMPAAAGIQ